MFVVSGLPNRRAALQMEWALKNETMKLKSIRDLVERRKASLASVLGKERVTRTAEPLSSWPIRMQYY